MRVLLVGESNPYGSEPEFALYPHPEGCAGWRLCHVILGMDRSSYLKKFDRINLCEGSWDRDLAGMRAAEIVATVSGPRKLILCGKLVATAFGLTPPGDLEPQVISYQSGITGLAIPHPSGRNLMWNDPEVVLRVREAVAQFSTSKGGNG